MGFLSFTFVCTDNQKHHRLHVSCGFFWLDASLSSRCIESGKITLDTTSYLQTCCKLLEQNASSLWIKSLDNQFALSLLTTCSGFVIIKPEQAMQMDPDISLTTARQKKPVGDLLQLAHVWQCT